jgi:hypothetical protein
LRRFIPPQHGAWAMLLLPWLIGVLLAGFGWLHVPLLLAWLTGYLASYYALIAVKTRRPSRVRTQLWAYGIPTVLLSALVLIDAPQVLWYAPAYGLLLAVNAAFAARRNERALVNGLASVVQSCLMVFVCATVAGAPASSVAAAFAALTAYFAGTVVHVKAMIRERGNPRFHWASITYHLVAFAGSVLLGPAVATVFALLAVRASVLPGRSLRPAVIGLVELVASVALLLALVLG